MRNGGNTMKKTSMFIVILCFVFIFSACHEKKESATYDASYANARYSYFQQYDSSVWDIENNEKDSEFIIKYELDGTERAGLINTFTMKQCPDLEANIYSIRQLDDYVNADEKGLKSKDIYQRFIYEEKGAHYYFNKLFVKNGIRNDLKIEAHSDTTEFMKVIGGYTYHEGEEPSPAERTVFMCRYTFTKDGEKYKGLLMIDPVLVFSFNIYTIEAKADSFDKYYQQIEWFIDGSGVFSL